MYVDDRRIRVVVTLSKIYSLRCSQGENISLDLVILKNIFLLKLLDYFAIYMTKLAILLLLKFKIIPRFSPIFRKVIPRYCDLVGRGRDGRTIRRYEGTILLIKLSSFSFSPT